MQETTYSENKQNRKAIEVEGIDKEGNAITRVIPIAAGTITVNKDSKRGLYKHLKKAMNSQKKPTSPIRISAPQPGLIEEK